MYIKKAELHNFGKFHHKTVCFAPGLNVVYGENESGKSTLHSFLAAMLFGMEKQRGRAAGGQPGKNLSVSGYQRYEPWNTSSYYTGSMEFIVAGREFTLERNFYHKEKTARLYNQKDGEELSVEHGDLDMLLGDVSKSFYENTCCIAQAAVVTEADFAARLEQELVSRVHGDEPGADVGQALNRLGQRKKQTEQQLKLLKLQKQEWQKRLAWEQELLTADITQLEQRLAEEQEKGLAEDAGQEQKPAEDTGQEQKLAEERRQERTAAETEGILFRIPVIGWLLRLLRWLLGLVFSKKEKSQAEEVHIDKVEREAAVGNILTEQLEEKRTQLLNVQEELKEAMGVSAEERELGSTIKSIQLAAETLDKISWESYQDGRDDIEEAVSGIFSGITGGKYDRVEVTEDGRVFLYEDQKRLSPWQLSRGAMEQLYLALRLGAGRCMMQEEALPILLDETFCAYDELRLRRTLRWLADQREQLILFTCQKRELQLLEELGIMYHRILL